jgi:hypothetical protein
MTALTMDDLVHDGTGNFEVRVWTGKRWRTFVFPPYTTYTTENPIIENWEAVGRIDQETLSHKRRLDVVGWRISYDVNIPAFTRDYLVTLKELATWAATHPEPVYVIPHNDCPNRWFRCKVTGNYTLGWMAGKAVAHTIKMVFEGIDVYTSNVTVADNPYISHYSDTAKTYLAGDDGIFQYAATGCPWGFDEFRPGDVPAQFVYSGTSEIQNVIVDTVLERAMYLNSNERCHLNMSPVADGVAQCAFVFQSGSVTGVAGLMFRVTDNSNYYSIQVDLATNLLTIKKTVATVTTTLKTYDLDDYHFTLATGMWIELQAEFEDDHIRVKAKKREIKPGIASVYTRWNYIGDATDSTFTTGMAGMLAGASTNVYGKLLDLCSLTGVSSDYDTTVDVPWIAHYSAQIEDIFASPLQTPLPPILASPESLFLANGR